ncbi:MAG: hypothetical protein LBN00_06105 [Oscillospiraceae bacterium]|jgi:hypothetical protein|nr:hypothetical protein [Oscillospiraceae bacterium]
MKQPKPYNPNRVFPKSPRGYKPEVLAPYAAVAEYYVKSKRKSKVTLGIFAAALVVYIVDAILDIHNIAVGWAALTLGMSVSIFFNTLDYRKLIMIYRGIVENGGLINNEKMKKEFDRRPARIVWPVVMAGVYFALAVATIILSRNGMRDTFFYIIFFMNMMNSGSSLKFGSTKYGTELLIFCDDRYISGGFSIAYDKITGVVLKEKDEYTDVTYATITLFNGDEQVGHDRMYFEDYEHLAAIIDARGGKENEPETAETV